MTIDDKHWYTEEWAEQGAAISLKLKDKLHDEQSPYQRIEIYETETFGTLMTLDGLVMVTDRDNFIYHEMMSHVPLFALKEPKTFSSLAVAMAASCARCSSTRSIRR